MTTILTEISTSPMISLGGFVLGIVGVVLAIVFYLKSKKVLRVNYLVRSFNLITDSISQLSDFAATYKGRSLGSLTASRLMLWNGGTSVISSSDVASTDPMRISLAPGSEVLNVKISTVSSATNSVLETISEASANEILINFEYLSPQEGCVIDFLHTGSVQERPKLVGTVKGYGSPIIYKRSWLARILDEVIAWVFATIAVAALAGAFFTVIDFSWPKLWTSLFLLAVAVAIIGISKFFESRSSKMRGNLDKNFRTEFSPSHFV